MADANSSSGGVDPITGFWRDVWARSTSAAAAAAGMPGATGGPAGNPFLGMPGANPGAAGGPAGADAFAAAFSPEAVRRMQNAFLEAMAHYAEEWMKSPQFLESLKRTMDRALEMRRQMDDFLQSNMASAFEAATGGANSEVMGAIRHSTKLMQEELARLAARLDVFERRAGRHAGASARSRTQFTPRRRARKRRRAQPE